MKIEELNTDKKQRRNLTLLNLKKDLRLQKVVKCKFGYEIFVIKTLDKMFFLKKTTELLLRMVLGARAFSKLLYRKNALYIL